MSIKNFPEYSGKFFCFYAIPYTYFHFKLILYLYVSIYAVINQVLGLERNKYEYFIGRSSIEF